MNVNQPFFGRGSPSGRGGNFKSLPPLRSSRRDPVSLAEGDATIAWNAITRWVDAGYFIGLSRTSDGGAVRILRKAGDAADTTYCADADELNDAFEALDASLGVEQPNLPLRP